MNLNERGQEEREAAVRDVVKGKIRSMLEAIGDSDHDVEKLKNDQEFLGLVRRQFAVFDGAREAALLAELVDEVRAEMSARAAEKKELRDEERRAVRDRQLRAHPGREPTDKAAE